VHAPPPGKRQIARDHSELPESLPLLLLSHVSHRYASPATSLQQRHNVDAEQIHRNQTRRCQPRLRPRASIRVNCICPGIVKINLLTSAEWANFLVEYFTPVDKIGEVVLMLLDGRDDGNGAVGRKVEEGSVEALLRKGMNGRAVEVSGRRDYYRKMVKFADEAMRSVIGATNIEVLEDAAERTP
jgi:hypothetical protein